MNPRLAIATCAVLPKGEEDGPLLRTALAGHGIEPELVVWDDPGVDWNVFDLVVIRSTWDYTDKLEAFLAWVRSVPRILNPPAVVEWNTEKTYLADLTATGVPTIPTRVLRPLDPLGELPAGDFVVKPSVSAGSRDTTRFRPGQENLAEAEVRRLHAARRTVVLQPYVESVDARGETAVLFLGGEFSHSVTKGPMLTPDRRWVDDLYYAEDIGEREATTAERALAERALAAVPGGAEQLLYARVDVVDGPDGPLVLELELTEPSLFLARDAGAADRLAEAIGARV